nr:immunoglobulin light chain junction region [Macaca mulatta]
CLQDNNFPWTF